jgi:hypothetical protein
MFYVCCCAVKLATMLLELVAFFAQGYAIYFQFILEI